TEANVHALRERLFELASGSFNLNSARQVERALVDRGADLSGLPRTEKTEQVMFTSQTLALIDDELARTLEAYRQEKKLCDYIRMLYRRTWGSRLYWSIRQCGSDTARMAGSNPNLMAIPKGDLRVRYVICAGEGKTLVACDLSNVELRLLGCYAGGSL